jgi:hypothetical protein
VKEDEFDVDILNKSIMEDGMKTITEQSAV